jgi:cytidylate kinase
MAIITIGGNIGAGKTTLADSMAEALHYDQLYMGRIFRRMAAEWGLTIDEFYNKLKDNPELERKTDDEQARMMREKDNVIFQGRIAWYFAKKSPFLAFNILLTVSPEVGAQRVSRREEYVGKSPEEMLRISAARERAEREHYLTLYGIENFLDPKHYDFILDTSKLTEQEKFNKVLWEVKTKLQNRQK